MQGVDTELQDDDGKTSSVGGKFSMITQLGPCLFSCLWLEE